MAFTHFITRGYRDSSGTTQQVSETITADTEKNFDSSIAVSSTNIEVDLTITRANMQSLMLYTDKAVTMLFQDATGKAVAGVTNTNSVAAVINVTAHGYAVGQRIHIFGIGGATNLNLFAFVKTVVDADNFNIALTSGGSTVVGNGASYTSGGSVRKLTTVTLQGPQEIIWNLAVDGLTACPLTADIDTVYLTNASSTDIANVKIRSLQHQTNP